MLCAEPLRTPTQTDDRVIRRANSPGQYFFPKRRYEWIIAILNCLMIFPLSCNLFRGVVFLPSCKFILAEWYTLSNKTQWPIYQKSGCRCLEIFWKEMKGKEESWGKWRLGRCSEGVQWLAHPCWASRAPGSSLRPAEYPDLLQTLFLLSWSSGSLGALALLAIAVWGTQKAIRPGSESLRGFIMECGFFFP